MNWEGYGDIDTVSVSDGPPADAVLVRQSTSKSMALCPAKQGYLLSGEAKQVPSEAMSFGTMIHTFAEERLRGNTAMVTFDMLEQWWVEAVEKDGFDLYDLVAPERLRESLQEAIEACAAWDKDVYPRLGYGVDDYKSGELQLELRMEFPLGVLPNGREVWMHGTPDVTFIPDNPTVRTIDDWKTARRGWDISEADMTQQLDVYSWLAERTEDAQVLQGTYWVWNRDKRYWEPLSTSRTDAQVEATMRHMWQVARQIDGEAFPFKRTDVSWGKHKRGWWCSPKYCAAWDVCEGKHLNDDVWEETPIDVYAGWQ